MADCTARARSRIRCVRRLAVPTCLIVVLTMTGAANAQHLVKRAGDSSDTQPRQKLWLPYGFYSNNFELAVGIGGGLHGHGQPQLGLFGAALVSTNSSYGFYGANQNLRVPPFKRLFMTGSFGYTRFTALESFLPGNPAYAEERAGGNDSSKNNFIETRARDSFAYLDWRYLLPIGDGRPNIVNSYYVEDGLLHSGATGGDRWNPLEGGRSYIELETFFRQRKLELGGSDRDIDTNGLGLALEYDNRDWVLNPARGSRQRLQLRRDFASFGSSSSWTTFEIECSKYFSLGTSRRFKQRVLALDVWTIDALSWDETILEDGSTVREGVPPYFEGSRLGGFSRMRGYPRDRFHDRSAVYYSAELRLLIDRSPATKTAKLGSTRFGWWQFAGFVELGRVAPGWSLSELHEDMKWDLGVGVRTLLNQSAVMRIDLAFSDQGAALWVMAGHAF